MFQKLLSLFLISFSLNFAGYSTVQAQTVSDKDAKRAAKVQSRLEKIEDNFDGRISVKLLDGTKIKGTVGKIYVDSFDVVDKAGKSTQIFYSQVDKIDGRYNKTQTGLAIFGVFILTVYAISGPN